MNKPQRIVSIGNQNSKRVSRSYGSLSFSTNMKDFLVFVLILSLLIAAEYYFFTEIFTQRRVVVIVISLTVVLLSIYQLVRFFRRSFISS
jgi:hypothetical protein